jgi:Uri superfamily endonuclease
MIPDPDSGFYALLLYLRADRRIRIGQKGVFNFDAGHYVYIGSARPGLTARLARHGRSRKTLRWHIDYLRKKAGMIGAWTTCDGNATECGLAEWFQSRPGALNPLKGFGASDCRCPGHLVYLPDLRAAGLVPGEPVAGSVPMQWSG